MAFAVARGIRAGPLENTERNRWIKIQIGVRRIVLRRKLNRCDILHTHHCVRRLLDDDVAEFLRAGEAPQRLHGNLKCTGLVDRGLVKHAGGNLDVLTLQRQDDVSSGKAE